MSAATLPGAAADPRTAATIASLQAGHYAAMRVVWQIAQRQGGQELVDAARAELAGDPEALAAFGRALAKGRQP